MEIHTVPGRCMTILLHGNLALGRGGVQLLVRYAQRRRGDQAWGQIAVDEFRGRGETLLIARPAEQLQATVADYAMPFLRKYFTN